MDLLIIRLLLDFGMVVLIWMVQLIVYPSFQFYDSQQLERWHKKYTIRLAMIVIPLMLGQLLISITQLFKEIHFNSILYAAAILFLWGITFLIFVPLHHKIGNGKATGKILKKLENYNWIRTIIWALVFLGSFYEMVFN